MAHFLHTPPQGIHRMTATELVQHHSASSRVGGATTMQREGDSGDCSCSCTMDQKSSMGNPTRCQAVHSHIPPPSQATRQQPRRQRRRRPNFGGLLVLCLFALCIFVEADEFNYEVERRVLERLEDFLGDPVTTNQLISNFRSNGGFPNDLRASDRDLYLKLAFSVSQQLVYYALEDGTVSGYYLSNAYYREPGSAGYSVNDPNRNHHFNSCINSETGAPNQCRLAPGDDYISCDGDEPEDARTGLCPKMELCSGQIECDASDAACKSSQKWCRQYSISKAPDNITDTRMGFVPLTNHCIDKKGQFSEQPGAIIDPSSPNRDSPDVNMVSCTYGALGQSPVNRAAVQGPFGYCGTNGEICQNAFLGGYASFEYDARYRPWYISVKEKQKSLWQEPYPFFSLGIGVTYASPLYSTDAEGRQVFEGVLGVDYQFQNIVQFLTDNYGNTSTSVFIYEDAEPHYVIGSSTGSRAARNFLSDDLSTPCPVDRGEEIPCTPVRVKMPELSGHPMDDVLVEAYRTHLRSGYPRDILSVTLEDGDIEGVFVSQSTIYEQTGADLKWRVIVVSPGANSDTDAILPDTDVFPALCFAAVAGVAACASFLIILYKKRSQKAIVFADWRFTCAFVFGCTLLNVSSFALLGDNTDANCLLRMWSFHLFFAIALAPLFVKVWRIKQLVTHAAAMQRTTISNFQAATYTVPMIIGQIIILLVFTFVDPPVETRFIENIDGVLTQRVTCQSDTDAFFITATVYEAGFVFSGCILAYLTRNLNDDFGEAKQMIFAMYNIALVGIITVLLVRMANLSNNSEKLMQAVGVLWGTVFSTAAFVIPRMIQVQQANGGRPNAFSAFRLSRFTRSRREATTTQHEANQNSGGDNEHSNNANGTATDRSGHAAAPRTQHDGHNDDSISEISFEPDVEKTGVDADGGPDEANMAGGSGTRTLGLDDVSSGDTQPQRKYSGVQRADSGEEMKPARVDWTGTAKS